MTPLTPETGRAAAEAIAQTYANRVCESWTTGGVTVVMVTKQNGRSARYFTLEALAQAFPRLYFGV